MKGDSGGSRRKWRSKEDNEKIRKGARRHMGELRSHGRMKVGGIKNELQNKMEKLG